MKKIEKTELNQILGGAAAYCDCNTFGVYTGGNRVPGGGCGCECSLYLSTTTNQSPRMIPQ